MNIEQNVYAAYDTKAKLFLPLFLSHTDETAQREFTSALLSDKSTVGNHPTDFNLFHLGTFHAVSGELKPVENGAVCILTGLEAMAAARPTAVPDGPRQLEIGDLAKASESA